MKRIWSAILVLPQVDLFDEAQIADVIRQVRDAAGERTVVDVTLVLGGATPGAIGSVRQLQETTADFEAVVLGHRTSFLDGALAGVEVAIGERILVLDPREIDNETATALCQEEGADVVFLRACSRSLAWPARVGSAVASTLTGYHDQEFLNSFAMSRNAAPAFLESDLDPEMFRSMVAGMGLETASAASTRAARRLSVRRSLAYVAARWMDRSDLALRTATTLGILMAGLNLAAALWVVAANLLIPDVVEGWTTLSLQSSVMFFVLSLILALVGEHLVRISRRGESRRLVVYQGRSATRTRDSILNLG